MNRTLWLLLLVVLVVGCQDKPKVTPEQRREALAISSYASRNAIVVTPGRPVSVDPAVATVTGPATVYVIQNNVVRGTWQVPRGQTQNITSRVQNLDQGQRPLYYGWYENLQPNQSVPPNDPTFTIACVVCSVGTGQGCCPKQP